MKKEITRHIEIDKKQYNQLVYHSVLNILHAISGTIEIVKAAIGDDEAFKNSTIFTDELHKAIRNPEASRKKPENITVFKSIVLKEADEIREKHVGNHDLDHVLDFFDSNIQHIFFLLKKRLSELKIWGNSVYAWEYFKMEDIVEDLKEFLDAIAKNGNDNYKFVYSKDDLDDDSYLVTIEINNIHEPTILMPTMLLDCIHDLVANAKKYTEKKGAIGLKIDSDTERIVLTISDTGRGIPEEEIDKVVDFGYRGSNIKSNETSAGGFGLTKAYYIAKMNKGRFFIDSELNKGTTFILDIPKP